MHESNAKEPSEVERIDLDAARERAVTILSRDEFYEVMAERGLAYGPAFQVLSDLHRGVEDAVATLQLPDSVLREAACVSAASGAG